MPDKEKALMRQWVKNWQAAGAKLERIRRQEIRHADTRRAIENLDDAFRSALLHSKLRSTSGLVEQQRLFHRSKR